MSDKPLAVMDGVREYGSTGFPVELRRDDENGRLVVRAINEGGFSSTDVDLLDLLEWLAEHEPHLIAALKVKAL